MTETRSMFRESIEIPILNENVLGYLKTQDGLVILLKDCPETFEIAERMLELLRNRLKAKV